MREEEISNTHLMKHWERLNE